jgi:hypothetical protein
MFGRPKRVSTLYYFEKTALIIAARSICILLRSQARFAIITTIDTIEAVTLTELVLYKGLSKSLYSSVANLKLTNSN